MNITELRFTTEVVTPGDNAGRQRPQRRRVIKIDHNGITAIEKTKDEDGDTVFRVTSGKGATAHTIYYPPSAVEGYEPVKRGRPAKGDK